MKKRLAMLILAAVTACQSAPETYQPQPVSFKNERPFKVNVAQVKLVENYRSPMAYPNVEHQFPTSPANGVKQWTQDRMQAVGRQGTLEISIDDASVKEVLLPRTGGVTGLFKDEQQARYDATLRVSFRLYNGTDPMAVASGDVLVSRSKSINERSTADDRTRMFDEMFRDMMSRFNDGAEHRLNEYFANYLTR